MKTNTNVPPYISENPNGANQILRADPRELLYKSDSTRLEAVATCVGFDDLLDVTLEKNHPHMDTMIVVTTHADKATQAVARKHGAKCVQTDLFQKNGRNFNKGAAINAGFGYFQYHGWRMHLDCDIVLPDNFRRMFFNNTHRDEDCLYGCDRMDVTGQEAISKFLGGTSLPQHHHEYLINPHAGKISARYVDGLRGYVPIGFFQLWHARCQHGYPFSLGTAEHDDVLFASLWPESQRRCLPTAIVYHLCPSSIQMGGNWDGRRSMERLKK